MNRAVGIKGNEKIPSSAKHICFSDVAFFLFTRLAYQTKAFPSVVSTALSASLLKKYSRVCPSKVLIGSLGL